MSKTHSHRHHPLDREFQVLSLLGLTLVVLMSLVIMYGQQSGRFAARVYEPIPLEPGGIAEEPSDELRLGACCAVGECLDLSRADCTGEGYIYWPDVDVCLTACPVIK